MERVGASEAPGGKMSVLGREIATVLRCVLLLCRLDASDASVSHETAKYSQTRQNRVGQSGCV